MIAHREDCALIMVAGRLPLGSCLQEELATVTAVGNLTTLVIARLDFTIFVAGNPTAAAAVANVAQERALADERRGLS